MATLNDLAAQSREIGGLAVQIRDYLVKRSTLLHFLKNPSLAESIIANTSGHKWQRIVLYGLKESLVAGIAEIQRQGVVVDAAAVDVLPSKQALDAQRSNNWLQAGDIIGGWINYLADRPRVIDDVLLNGYRWHFLGDEANVKGPGLGANQFDKWLQSYGWVKLSGTDVGSIHVEQTDELTELRAQLQFFQEKQFSQN